MSRNLIARIAQWLANELIVKGLAKNPTFQRFAHRTHAETTRMAEKAAQSTKNLVESESAKKLKEDAAQHALTVMETAKGLAEIFGQRIKNALISSNPPSQPPKLP
mmetsp:Transcript_20697/g.35662  ORF Transcript_20697/g.35662 Transcript_20697/m.35662 type:complete len:106 (+) Transcript_20697:168-485(+)|eukprot:CAMPEP_0184692376 /NCGR_PEP_ID=MMETSP0313-20130426/886_1 /TAXON_ID=2792 /ORGANISM="Porphyridium aerugineum, Strain SAG 1380-2" /LENGTH=105 /DNA_ID=CAMNT_0027150203 /DNA_START=151 /DNA_END=468 /DNA_ORIENTATION=-